MKKRTVEEKTPKRANGLGCLFKRGNMWWGKIMRKGVLTVRSTGIHVHEPNQSDKTLREAAEAKLLAQTAPMRLGAEVDALLFLKAKIESLTAARRNAVAISQNRNIRLKDAASEFKKAREKAGNDGPTTRVYIADLEEFVTWRKSGDTTEMAAITHEVAEMYAKHLEKKNLAPYTFNRKVTGLRLIWQTLGVTDVNGAVNPWEGIMPKKKDTVVRDSLTDDEISRLKNAAGTKYGGDLRMLFVIGEFTGLRLSDAATLKWSEADTSRGIVCKKTSKTGAVIYAPILPEFARELAEHMKRTKEWDESRLSGLNVSERRTERMPDGFGEYVVPRLAAKAVRKNGNAAISVAVAKVFKAAGVNTSVKVDGSKRLRTVKGFHSLRATWVTRCQAAGIPLSVIMSTVGHSTANMTQHYTHIKEQEVLDAFKKAGVFCDVKKTPQSHPSSFNE